MTGFRQTMQMINPPNTSSVPFEQKAFVNKTFPAWYCTCNDYCRDSQFWAHSCGIQLNPYCSHHEDRYPWQVLGCDKNSTNAVLCHRCHSENFASKEDHNKGKGTLSDMALVRRLSSMNGFGPHTPPTNRWLQT